LCFAEWADPWLKLLVSSLGCINGPQGVGEISDELSKFHRRI
jgi:hypothetical protein